MISSDFIPYKDKSRKDNHNKILLEVP